MTRNHAFLFATLVISVASSASAITPEENAQIVGAPSVPIELDCSQRTERKFPPQYPASAAKERHNGWVQLAYTVSADGKLQDLAVVDERPSGVFTEASLSALRKWVFRPSDQPSSCQNVLTFSLSQ